MPDSSVLIAAWYFPPDGGAGSQRPASFAKHLPGLGWNCRVITRSESISRGRWDHFDRSLLSQVSNSTEVVRVDDSGPFADSKFPGERSVKSRIGPFCRRVLDEVARTSPDVLLLTMSPFILSEVLNRIPEDSPTKVVVDLRDPWTLDYWPVFISSATRRRQHLLMGRMLERADGIVMNTTEATSQCLEIFGQHLSPKTLTLENGFEADQFPAQSVRPPFRSSDRLRIMHTGTFHCESLHPKTGIRARIAGLRHVSRGTIDRTGRTPHHLFRAAGILRDENPEFASRLQFDFLGDVDASLNACVRDGGFSSQTTLHGYQDHDRMLEMMLGADALFLPGGRLDAHVRDPITPGKTYEYLASGRPVLAALHPGSGLDLVTSCPGVFPCEPCSPRTIADAITATAAFLDSGGDHALMEERRLLIAPFLRSALTERLSDFMKRVKRVKRASEDGSDSGE